MTENVQHRYVVPDCHHCHQMRRTRVLLVNAIRYAQALLMKTVGDHW